MSYQVLARKWRPAKFEQMVGQAHVLLALTNALSQQRLHHAYLFTGTRGVGKTSLARLFAKGLNCEQGVTANPCGVCSSCEEIAQGRFVDLIEVDAASRTKVDDTRELLDNVQYRPSRGRYKVYLIDEVHMLSRSSFNALLKTLEEPPEHVKFLLATTDPQKLPVTVLSRCLQFNLKSLSQEEIAKQLDFVLTQEQLPFEDQALTLLSKAANGSMRDALSLTDQAIAFGSGQVMHQQVQTMLGSIDQQQVIALLKALCDADIEPLMHTVAKVLAFGADAQEVLRSLLELLHQITLTQFAPAAAQSSLYSEQILAFAQQISAEQIQLYYQMLLAGRKDLPFAPDPKSGLEMALLRAVAFVPEKQVKRWITDTPAKVDLTEAAQTSQEVTETRPKSAAENVTEQASVAVTDDTIRADAASLDGANVEHVGAVVSDADRLVEQSTLLSEPVQTSTKSQPQDDLDDKTVLDNEDDAAAELIAQQAMLLNQAESMGFARNSDDSKDTDDNETSDVSLQSQTEVNAAGTIGPDVIDNNQLSGHLNVHLEDHLNDQSSVTDYVDYGDIQDDDEDDQDNSHYEDYLAYNQHSAGDASLSPIQPTEELRADNEPFDSLDVSSVQQHDDSENNPPVLVELDDDPLDDILDLVLASRDTLLAEVIAHKAQDEVDASHKKAADKQQVKQSKLGSVSTLELKSHDKIAPQQSLAQDEVPLTVTAESASNSTTTVTAPIQNADSYQADTAYDRPPWEAPTDEDLAQKTSLALPQSEPLSLSSEPISEPEITSVSASHANMMTDIDTQQHVQAESIASIAPAISQTTIPIATSTASTITTSTMTDVTVIGHEITGHAVDLHWYQVMAQVKVGGRVRQLGVNSLCKAVSNPIQLTLKPDQKHLCADIAIGQLQAGLSAFLQQDIQVNIDIGQDPQRETPLELRKRFHRELVLQAKQSILTDDNVKWMIDELAAQLDDDSVVYPPEQLNTVAEQIPALLG
ncbi:DNA polymerase III subunit gamma/tau [Shewanella sp. OMA3-2]|uniref:DNA polymerase III subunit gamma/tau n=1 Tax=Shewanella sp. OMA3-2 TaxID=2908650 RepID=UPI001F30A8A7|nr:DNA polymerase III subunit gamma/tau [Shewanella sp. OMA3-2]UJF21100.1 DNA polymerase III subunit gamma/tau [Shewanella sp. OMA3-2]